MYRTLIQMNPQDRFVSDHRSLKSLAAELRAAIDQKPPALTEKLAGFQKTVQAHFRREDIYYRILDNDKRVADRGLIHQLRNDHAAVIFTLESLAIRLRKNGVNSDWRGRFDTLMKVFLPHLDLEEKALFPIGRETLTQQELKMIEEQINLCG